MSASPYTFADLSTPETQSAIRARLVSNLGADGQPTGSWAPSSVGGSENLRLDMVSGGLASLASARVAALVNGRLLDIATDDPLTGYWLSYLGLRFYGLQKRQATTTIQNIALVSGPNASANTFGDGDLWVKSPSTGNLYRLTLPPGQTLTLPANFAINAPFYAAAPGSAYSDPALSITQMVTAKAGITCTNLRPEQFRPTRSTGGSTGTVTATFLDPSLPPFTGVPAPAWAAVRVRIDVGGDLGTAQFSWSTDGGVTWTSGGACSSKFAVPGGGYLVFANGFTPSFAVGTIFTCRVGDCFLQRGADAETDQAFRSRCRNRWPALSLVPTRGEIELWSMAASPEVVRVSSDADANNPGGILVTIASQTGPATPLAQEAVEDFILARLGFSGLPAPVAPTYPGSSSPRENVLVSSAPAFQVTAAGYVTVPSDQLAGAIAGADAAWNAYLASLPLGDGHVVVELERFRTILGDLGATDIQSLTLNNVVADLVVPVGQVPVPATGWTLAANIQWIAGSPPGVAAPAAPPALVGGPFSPNPQSISDLIPPLSLDDVKAFLLAYISVPQNPVNDYESGAALRTYWEIESNVIQDLCSGITALAANGYPGPGGATGTSLTMLASGWYGLKRGTASAATQTVDIACDGGHGPYTAAQVAAIKGITTDGASYSVTAGAAPLTTGGAIAVTMTADSPGAARGLVAALLVGLPGVAVTGASIATFGADGEGDAALAEAVAGRFGDLSAIPIQDRTISWALAAAPPPLITRFRLDADPAIPGGVLLTLANASGPVAGGTVTAVQAALDDLSPITDNNTAQNSTARAINATGIVTVRASLLPAAQAASDAAWSTYLASAQIGAKVFLEALAKAVGDAIKSDPNSNFVNPALGGAGADGNVALAATEVPTAGSTLTSNLTWVAI